MAYPGFLNFAGMLVNAISVIVAFVPEGMPICVTLCLTLIAKRSYRQKILCKSLPVVETLGCVSIICSVSKWIYSSTFTFKDSLITLIINILLTDVRTKLVL